MADVEQNDNNKIGEIAEATNRTKGMIESKVPLLCVHRTHTRGSLQKRQENKFNNETIT